MSEKKLVRPDLDDGATLNRREAIEILANELMGHLWGIEDAGRVMDDLRASKERTNEARESIVADRQAARTLRRVARKLGVYEEVEREATE